MVVRLWYQILSLFDVQESVRFIHAGLLNQIVQFADQGACHPSELLQFLSQNLSLALVSIEPVLMNELIAFNANRIESAEQRVAEQIHAKAKIQQLV